MGAMKVITVSQLNRYVKSLLEGDRNLAAVYIGGEISNFTNHYKSGHLYLSLKDEGALVRAVMFRAYASKLAFTPENGMKVIVRARVSLYEKDGSFQLYIEEMQPDGVGALQVAYEQVITSPTGAAVRDILNVLGRRYPLARVVFCPVLVQGEGAPPQLIEAVERLNAMNAADVIIIGRGGGSIEELWAFNDEGVARAVAASRIPVISAVGHETDFTICDFAADLRAPTPSAAAELAVPDQAQLAQQVLQLQAIALRAVRNPVDNRCKALEALKAKRCLATPLFYVEEQAMRLDYVTRAFAGAAHVAVTRADRRLAAAAGKLDALSPLKVLSRGYSIVYTRQEDGAGRVASRTADIPPGARLTLRLSDGTVDCTADPSPEK